MSEASPELVAWIRRDLERHPADLPAFPSVASRCVGLLERRDADLGEVERLIAQDQAIASHVLRAANSAFYGGVVPVDTVGRAVMRLGFRETAQVVMGAACRSLFDMGDRAELEAFPELWSAAWQDSMVGAYGARLIARELKLGDPERAFLGGMFRNVGSLLVLKLVAAGLVRGRLARPPASHELAHAIATLHVPFGARHLRDASMPAYVVDAVERHHAPELPFSRESVEIHVVRVADGLCERLGISPFAGGELPPHAGQSVEALQIDAAQLEYFDLQLAQLAEQTRDLL